MKTLITRSLALAALLTAACVNTQPLRAQDVTTAKARLDSARTDLRRYCKTGKPVGYLCPVDTLRLARASAALVAPAPTPTPTPFPAPDTSAVALIKALSGPLIPVSQVPSVFSFYETNFKHYIDSQWVVFGAKWDAGNSISGYERGAINYIYWVRTGDTTYKTRAHQTVVNYRDNYLVPNNYSTSPHWSQAESVYLDCVVMKDPASCDGVGRIASNFIGFDPVIADTTKDWLENRVQVRVLTAWWMAEKLQGQGQWSTLLDNDIPKVLAMQNDSGYWAFPRSTCNTELPYMEGMLADFMTRIYDQRPRSYNPAILTAMTKLGNRLWNTQWRGTANPSDLSFNYLSGLCMGTGSPTSAPDLNGLIAPLFGWLGKTTGDTTWFVKGDKIIAGMKNASVYLYRQFSESYSSSPRYFGYRYRTLAAAFRQARSLAVPQRKKAQPAAVSAKRIPIRKP